MSFLRTAFNSSLRFIAYCLSIIMIIGGIFLVIVGPLNGFGNPDTKDRLIVTGIGLTSLLLGLYIFYVLNERSIKKSFETILEMLFSGNWYL